MKKKQVIRKPVGIIIMMISLVLLISWISHPLLLNGNGSDNIILQDPLKGEAGMTMQTKTNPASTSVLTEEMDLYCVTFTGTNFIAGGSIGGSSVATLNNEIGKTLLVVSEDGMTIQKCPVEDNIPISDIASSNGGTVIAAGDALKTETYGFYHSSLMFKSTDNGSNWTEVPGINSKRVVDNPAFTNTYMVEELVFYKDQFYSLDFSGHLYKSSDGIDWEKTSMNLGSDSGMGLGHNEVILWTRGIMDVPVYFGTNNKWRKTILKDMSDVGQVFYVDDHYYCYAWYDCCYGEAPIDLMIYESNNGSSWTVINEDANWDVYPYDLIKINGLFIGITSGGRLLAGETISSLALIEPSITGISDIAYGNGMVVAVGGQGKWYYSKDGIQWNPAK